jgi:phosphate:Na+ symporter
MGEVERALTAMTKAARDNVLLGLEQLRGYDSKRSEAIDRCEEMLDRFADHADNFLIELSHSMETERENNELTAVMQCVPCVERIGDYATNFNEMGCRLYESGHDFSEGAKEELRILGDAVMEILRLSVEAMESGSETMARRIEPLEEVIDDMVLLLRKRHTERLCQGVCAVDAGIVFMDVLTHLERTADQCSDIAMLLLGKRNAQILNNHHQYLQDLHSSSDQSYLAEIRNRKEQYLVPLESIKL